MAETSAEIITNDFGAHKIMESRLNMLPSIINTIKDAAHRKSMNGAHIYLGLARCYSSVIIALGNATITMHASMDPKSLVLCIDKKMV